MLSDLHSQPSLNWRLEVLLDSLVGVVSNCTVGLFFWTLSLFLLAISKLLRQLSKFVLVSSPTVQLDKKGAFHLPRNSGNSVWDVNGTHVFKAFQWKVAGNKWNFEKVVLFCRWKLSGGNAWSIYQFSQGITTSRLCRAKSVPPTWILVTRA